MLLKHCSNANFILSMKLSILYDLEQINVCISLQNLGNHKTQTKFFPASDFSAALRYYETQEKFFF